MVYVFFITKSDSSKLKGNVWRLPSGEYMFGTAKTGPLFFFRKDKEDWVYSDNDYEGFRISFADAPVELGLEIDQIIQRGEEIPLYGQRFSV